MLVEQGKITPDQLNQALEYQKQERLKGNSPLIGQVIVELGFLDQPTLDQSITQQILILQNNLRQANENLEQRVKNAELEKAYRFLNSLTWKQTFVSNISHELRTPLTHINGYVELLLTDKKQPLSLEHRQSVDVIKTRCRPFGKLIDDLILFSTSEADKLVIEYETITTKKLIAKSVIEHAAAGTKTENAAGLPVLANAHFFFRQTTAKSHGYWNNYWKTPSSSATRAERSFSRQ